MPAVAFNLTAYVVAVIFVATLIRSTLGFGEALVAVPLLALRTPVEVAAPLAVLVSIVVAGVVVVQDRRGIEFRAAAGLILASLVGIPLGVLLLVRVDDQVVKLLLGSVIIAFSLYSLTMGRGRSLSHDHVGWLIVCGFFAGVLGGAYGMNGPPLAIYGALRKWSPQHFRATLQAYFLPVSVVGLAGYSLIGLWTAAVTWYFFWSLPAVIIATFAGRAINQRMKGEGFVRVVYGGLLLTGAVLFLQAVAAIGLL
ncbi:MAG TPA: sulfite exporter TauE/SafE family protein [Vicinamibacterales bacterium]